MGRPSKGLRSMMCGRVPILIAAQAQRAADEQGLTISDWVAEAIRARLAEQKANR